MFLHYKHRVFYRQRFLSARLEGRFERTFPITDLPIRSFWISVDGLAAMIAMAAGSTPRA
jgi:hypothetical protein